METYHIVCISEVSGIGSPLEPRSFFLTPRMLLESFPSHTLSESIQCQTRNGQPTPIFTLWTSLAAPQHLSNLFCAFGWRKYSALGLPWWDVICEKHSSAFKVVEVSMFRGSSVLSGNTHKPRFPPQQNYSWGVIHKANHRLKQRRQRAIKSLDHCSFNVLVPFGYSQISCPLFHFNTSLQWAPDLTAWWPDNTCFITRAAVYCLWEGFTHKHIPSLSVGRYFLKKACIFTKPHGSTLSSLLLHARATHTDGGLRYIPSITGSAGF